MLILLDWQLERGGGWFSEAREAKLTIGEWRALKVRSMC